MPPFRIDSKDGILLDRSELIAEPRFLFRLFILDLCKLVFVRTETVAAMYFFCFQVAMGNDCLRSRYKLKATRDTKFCQQLFALFNTI